MLNQPESGSVFKDMKPDDAADLMIKEFGTFASHFLLMYLEPKASQ